MAIQKTELTKMIQNLSDNDVPLVYNLLSRLINHPNDEHIPFDNEPLTDNDLNAIKEAEEDYKKKRTIRLEDFENE